MLWGWTWWLCLFDERRGDKWKVKGKDGVVDLAERARLQLLRRGVLLTLLRTIGSGG